MVKEKGDKNVLELVVVDAYLCRYTKSHRNCTLTGLTWYLKYTIETQESNDLSIIFSLPFMCRAPWQL